MAITTDTSRLRELVEEIAVTRNRLAVLRAEREAVLTRLRSERAERDDPLYGLTIQVVYGAGGSD